MKIAMLVFPGITATDYVGPGDLLARIPGAQLLLIWKHKDPIQTDLGWDIRATDDFTSCGQLDMIVVPGGPGIGDLLADRETLQFLARQAEAAKWVVGICTGPLVLGAAGLLNGYSSTCHWASHELLAQVGAIPVKERVVVDRNRITGAGMTSGLDCALHAIALAAGPEIAKGIQLFAEYDPQPPFDSGAPHKAAPAMVQSMRDKIQPIIDRRREILAGR